MVSLLTPKDGNAPANEESNLCRYEIIAAVGRGHGLWNRADFQPRAGKFLAVLPVACLAGGLRRGLADGLLGPRLAKQSQGIGAGTDESSSAGASPFARSKNF